MSYYPPPVYIVQTRTSGAAIVSLVCGIAGLLGFHVCGAFIVGIICGHIALSTIKNSNGTVTGRGLALAGLFLNYLPLIAVLVVGIGFLALTLLGAIAASAK